MGRSLWLTLNQNLGFDPRGVAMVSFSPVNRQKPNATRSRAFEQKLLDNVKTLPLIQSAALSQADFTGVAELPFSTSASPSAPSDEMPIAYWWSVTPGFFSVMRIPLLRGRYLSGADGLSTQPVVVINQSLARTFFSGTNPIGKHVTYFTYDPQLKKVYAEIVGVVPDTKMSGFTLPSGPEIYTCMWQQNWAFGVLFVRSNAPGTALMSALREKVQQTNKGFILVDVKPLDQAVKDTFFARPRFLTYLVSVFAGMALIVTGVGVFAATALSVTRRTHEIGIRIALGAQQKHVLKAILSDSFIIACGGVFAGTLAAFVLARLIRSWLYGVAPDDPLTFVAAGAVLLLVCLLAAYIPARRALRVDPAVVLRHE